MARLLYYLIITGVLISLSSHALAKDEITHAPLNCTAKHLYTDQLVEVKISHGITGKKIAAAQWHSGHPTIVIDDSAFVRQPINIRLFIYYHECAHLTLTDKGEAVADCESLNSLVEKQHYSELDIRKLIRSLAKQLGLSQRWSNLLNCSVFLEH